VNAIKVVKENKRILKEYSKIPISFVVDYEYEIKQQDYGKYETLLEEKKVESYSVDFDSVDDNPSRLGERFNIDNWPIFVAYHDSEVVGGAIIAHDTEGVNMLEGKSDLAVLWDLRVCKEFRSQGVGTILFKACLDWATEHNCTRMKIETQNTNVKACKFYAKQGAKLINVNKNIYEDNPNEVQLIWNIDIK